MITVISTHQLTTRRNSFSSLQTKSNVLLPLSIMFLLLFVAVPIEPIMCFTIGGERLPTRLLGRTSTKSNGSSYTSSAVLRNSNPSLTDVGVNHGAAFSNNSKNNIVESPLYSDDHAVDDYLEFLDRRYRYVILKKGV
jgi:hypothetical protein